MNQRSGSTQFSGTGYEGKKKPRLLIAVVGRDSGFLSMFFFPLLEDASNSLAEGNVSVPFTSAQQDLKSQWMHPFILN